MTPLVTRPFVPILLITITAMAPAQPLSDLLASLSRAYDQHRQPGIESQRFTQDDLLRWLAPLRRTQAFAEENLGHSVEGRPLLLMKYGNGATRVLLWSQMHGDEPTATMALMDMMRFFSADPDHPVVRTLRERLTVLLLPMLNPDGAERFQRRNTQQIDINRDALALRSPEARALWAVRNRFAPDFGFNLHDQDPRYTVGTSTRVTTISLLAPAVDPERSNPPGRLRAHRLAALLAEVFELLAPGHTARYDDTFEPRAFGDNIQKAGTSTVLVESGGWPNDRDKQFLRRLNFIGLTAALHAIATGSYQSSDLSAFDNLPFNSKNLYDLIIRNALFQPDGAPDTLRVDIGVNFDWKSDSSASPARWVATIMDLGDLRTFGCFEEMDGSDLRLTGEQIGVERMYPREEFYGLLGRNQE